MKNLFLFLLIPIVLGSSCRFIGGKRVRGNGNWKTEERSVSNFKEVQVSGAIDVIVSTGSVAQVKVETDENLQQYIEVIQNGDQLEIRNKSGYSPRPTRDMKVYVTSPSFTHIGVSGACDIYSQGRVVNPDKLEMNVSGAGSITMDLDAPNVFAQISGSGDVKLSGQTRDLEINLSGAADAKCYDMKAENTSVHISGAGDAEVYASVSLDAQVSGAGSVKYKGNAAKVNQQVSGAGSVKKAE